MSEKMTKYLGSAQAYADVRGVLNDNWSGACAVGQWTQGKIGAWDFLTLVSNGRDQPEAQRFAPGQSPVVYFRRHGSGSMVSDLGEGMRTRRLRAGEWNLDEDPADRLTTGVTDDKATLIHGMVVWRRDAAAEDLPEAIRLVMLASHCIANLTE